MRSVWRDQRLGAALVAAGIVVAAVGVLGLRSDDGDVAAGRAVTTTTAASPAPTTMPAETPEHFLADVLTTALRTGDVDTLVARLHPDVIVLYGEAACHAYLPGVVDPNFELTIREIGAPGPWTYEVDGRALEIPEALPVEVSRLVNGETVIQELHIASIEREWRWFTDCGEPIREEAGR